MAWVVWFSLSPKPERGWLHLLHPRHASASSLLTPSYIICISTPFLKSGTIQQSPRRWYSFLHPSPSMTTLQLAVMSPRRYLLLYIIPNIWFGWESTPVVHVQRSHYDMATVNAAPHLFYGPVILGHDLYIRKKLAVAWLTGLSLCSPTFLLLLWRSQDSTSVSWLVGVPFVPPHGERSSLN